MKHFLLFLVFFFSCAILFGQLNMRLMSRVSYDQQLSDVWGWVDPQTGTEYAIVGVFNGVSIVSLENPENATEVEFIPGPNSTWRDIKTWGNFAYVTNETSNGVLVIDMSGLPDNITYYDWTPTENQIGGTLSSCHNLYIDEFGYCYLAGCNLNQGGLIMVDVFSEPGVPKIVGWGPAIYSHDVYARDNKAYSSEIYIGVFSIYDVADKANPALVASQSTPFNFTHNTWLSDDGRVIFTTDERANAPVAAYDISDPDNIQYLDEYRPIKTLGTDVIPHNVHVWQDWLIISYYTDGGIVVDASRPSNLIEVGNFDSFFGANAGFDGAWGAYPFLPSQTVLVSDMSNGLYVLQPNYVRACWLEGKVSDASTGIPLDGVDIQITFPDEPNLGTTDFSGTYATGLATAGTYEVEFAKPGYLTKILTVTLENGVVTTLDAALEPLPMISIRGKVIEKGTGVPIPNTMVNIKNDQFDWTLRTDASGNFAFGGGFQGDYTIGIGVWGHSQQLLTDFRIDGLAPLVFELEKKYEDDFIFDLGWQTSADPTVSAGFWERGVPIGTTFRRMLANPDMDIQDDLGDLCYMTENGGGSSGSTDLDDGAVFLTSPEMNLSTYNKPLLYVHTWFFNDGGSGPAPDDYLKISITNGSQTLEVDRITTSASVWSPLREYDLSNTLDLSGPVQIIFECADLLPNGHIVEGAVDGFEIVEGEPSSSPIIDDLIFTLQAYPNPTQEFFILTYENAIQGRLLVTSPSGQLLESRFLPGNSGNLRFGENLPAGVYFAQVSNGKFSSRPVKLVKL